jgi:ribose transport system substrate-binding protein
MEKKGIIFSIGLMGIVLVILFAFYRRIEQIGTDEKETYEIYDRHYAMITDESDSELWDQVYASALEEGKVRGVYVERFGSQLAVDYDRNQLLQMAIQASVDGIIVTGDEDEETVNLIDEAVDQGIPVVTVLRDSTGSRRQCFVGSNSYSIGQEYGRQILKLLTDMSDEKENTRVLVLMDESRLDTSQNLILLGIRETLDRETEEKAAVTVDTIPVDNVRSFSSEESIRDIFLDTEQIPDILVCLNAVYTRCAYQAAVDYNQVGAVQILGYYDSDAILEAVSKNIIDSTITLDTEQMGRLCVQALEEYAETGYTNSYQAVDTHLITSEEAKLLLEQR